MSTSKSGQNRVPPGLNFVNGYENLKGASMRRCCKSVCVFLLLLPASLAMAQREPDNIPAVTARGADG